MALQARIEEEVEVTPEGPRILTRFPADELLVTGTVYVRGAGGGVKAGVS